MVTKSWCNLLWGKLRTMTLHIRRSQGFETVAVIKHDAGVMEGKQNETENEVVDRSPGRNSTVCSDADETLLDPCIRQTCK